MSLRRRVTLGGVLGVLILTIGASFAFIRYTQTVAANQEIRQTLQPAGDRANALTDDVSELDRSLQVYAIETKTTSLRSFNRLYADAQNEVAAIDAMQADALTQARTDASVVGTRLDAWHAQVAVPVIAAVQRGEDAAARNLLVTPRSLALFNRVEDSTRELTSNLGQQRRQANDETAEVTGQLGRALLIYAGVSGLVFLAGIYFALRWFLWPLDQLRRQLRHVARRGNHNDPIVPIGPTEIAAAGEDAELMRRELVSQHDEARAATEGLAQEGPVVSGVRKLLDPSNPNLETNRIQIAGNSHAAEGVIGGDWWDSCVMTDDRIAMVLTDISGHGATPAISALYSKIATFDSIHESSDLRHVAANLATCFSDHSFAAVHGEGHEIRFATGVLLAFNPDTYELEWINAGHPSPIVIGPDGIVAELEPTGPMMSTLGGTWTSQKIVLAPGQTVIAWTDGLAEARDGKGNFLDDEGIAAVARQFNEQVESSAEDLLPLVLNNLRQQARGWDHDDITLVVMRIR